MKRNICFFGLAMLMASSAAWGAVSTKDIDGKLFFLECNGRTDKFVYDADGETLANSDYYDSEHIWKFESDGNGRFFIRNHGTAKYVGAVPASDKTTFKMVSKDEAKAYIVDFTLKDGFVAIYDPAGTANRNAFHVDSSSRLVRWDNKEAASFFSLADASSIAEQLETYYLIQHKNTNNYLCAGSSYSDSNGLKLTNGTKPTDKKDFWHIIRTDEGNYRFVSHGKVLSMSGSEASARAKMLSPTSLTGDVDFNGTIKFDGTASYIKIASSADNYWNKRGDYLALWKSAKAVGDNGSTFFITAIDDETAFYDEYMSATKGQRPDWISDFSLWYDTPAAHTGVSDTWMEYALPLGNGQIGATIRGGVFKDEIQFNEKTLWEGSTANSSQGYYQNFGSIIVTDLSNAFSLEDGSKPVRNYTRYLDIIDGVAGVDYNAADELTSYQRRYFISSTDGVFVARYQAEGNDKLHFRVNLNPDNQIKASAVTYSNATASFNGGMTVVSYSAALKVIASEGASVTTNEQGITVENATWAEIIMAADTDYDATKAGCKSGETKTALAANVDARISAAESKGYDSLLADHTEAFSALMNRVDLQLGAVSPKTTNALIDFYGTDANKTTPEGLYLESLYFQYGRYMTVAANLDTSIHAPSNLQGIWNDRSNSPFWHCDIHADINVQMNYWPADPTNLSEMHLPFLEHIIDLATAPGSPWKAFAQKIKSGSQGWTVAVENNIFGGTSTWSNAAIKTLGAWYCTHFWRYYQYTLDRDLLTRALPAMYDAALFIKSISSKDTDGRYVVTGEWSPEHGPENQITAFAQQTAYELLDNTMKAHAELGSDSPLTAAQIEAITDLYNNFDKGLWVEKYKDVDNISEWKKSPLTDQSHRHLSHLMCLFPFAQVSQFDDTDEGKHLFQAAYNGQIARNGDVTGWSMGWQTNTYARCGDGNKARFNLSRALGHSRSYVIEMSNFGGCYYNLFDAHSPFQIDGNYGCTSGVAEMLLQSFDNVINVLPARPDAWVNGHVSGLKAQGDYTVDIKWEDGKCVEASITNNRNEARSIKVRVNGELKALDFQPNETIEAISEMSGICDVVTENPKSGDKAVYDLLGRRVAAPTNGIFVSEGKVFVK